MIHELMVGQVARTEITINFPSPSLDANTFDDVERVCLQFQIQYSNQKN